MALVRVYCGLASANPPQQLAVGSSSLSATLVDDSGRLLDVCDIGDDPYGYAYLSTLLAERASGPYSVAIAADTDQRLVPVLLTAAGWALAYVDSESTDEYAERFADELSEEVESAPMQRRALGLARALHAGAISATLMPAAPELAGLKPVLAAHGALATGRHAAAVALREVLRELYPAALRAYPDPADPVALAVMEALPEPGALAATVAGRSRDAAATVDAVTGRLAAAGVADQAAVSEAITALRVAIAETPRRSGIGKGLTGTVAETVRQSVAAVRACDAASTVLVRALADRVSSPAPAPVAAPNPVAARVSVARHQAPDPEPLPDLRPISPVATAAPAPTPPAPARTQPAPAQPAPAQPAPAVARSGAPSRRMVTTPPLATRGQGRSRAPASYSPGPPASASPAPAPPASGPPLSAPRSPAPLSSAPQPRFPAAPQPPAPMPVATAPISPHPVAPPPTAPPPVAPPPTAPPPVAPPPSVLVAAPQPEWPERPEWTEWTESGSTSTAGRPVSAPPPPPPGITPIGEPRARRWQRSGDHAAEGVAGGGGGAGDGTVQVPTPRPTPSGDGRHGQPGTLQGPPPGSRASWPTSLPAEEPSWNSRGGTSVPSNDSSRRSEPPPPGPVTPPWQADDLRPPEPPEPVESPVLRLVEPTLPEELRDELGSYSDRSSSERSYSERSYSDQTYSDQTYSDRSYPDGSYPDGSYPDGSYPDGSYPDRRSEPPPLRLVEPPPGNGIPRSAPPVSADDDDNLLIFAQTRSAWFTGDNDNGSTFSSPLDVGWRAAEQASRQPTVGERTGAGLPRRVPHANLVPGSAPASDDRPLRVVRDPASIAAHTSGYFNGWRRGQEIGGYPLGGRQQAVGAWDFSREDERLSG